MLPHRTRRDPIIVTTFVLTIDFGMTLEKLIEAADLAHVDSGFTRRCFSPHEHRGVLSHEVGSFHFGYYLSTREAMDRILLHDVGHVWRPALVEHLISFGRTRPHEQLKHPINALGSRCMTRRLHSIPCLHHVNSARSLILDVVRWDRGWEADYRFLAYRSTRKNFFARLLHR